MGPRVYSSLWWSLPQHLKKYIVYQEQAPYQVLAFSSHGGGDQVKASETVPLYQLEIINQNQYSIQGNEGGDGEDSCHS